MSETVMLTSNPYPPEGERRGGTVGFPLPGVSVRVVGDDGAILRRRRGRRDRGARPERLRRLLAHAREDARGVHRRRLVSHRRRRPRSTSDGYVTIVGRSKDLIISGGYNVYPAEIESVLNDMPGVAESAVIGVPHPDFGEAVVAVRRARPGARARRRPR